MRLTEQILTAETTVLGLLDDDRNWAVWRDFRDRRDHRPTLLAIHTPTKTLLAVYVRPRRLYPSEQPAIEWLPPGVLAVVWHPTMRADIRVWLTCPTTTPPGLLGGSR